MNPSYEDFVDQTFSKRYRQLELDIMRDIVRRIKKTSEITSSADWQIMRLTIMGNSAEEIRNMIKEAGELSENDMQKLFDDVVEKEYTRSADLYKEVGANFVPYEQNTEMQQLTQALITQSNNELKSITGTMGFMLDYGDGKGLRFTPHTEIFSDYLNNAVMGVASGAFDYNTMIRRVVTQMTNSGLRTVDYASGRHDRVDVAARRAVLTGLSQLTGRITDTNAAALNTDHFEVAWHAGARPTHQEWQGRVWSKKELVDVCGLGSVTGLLGANCYHDYYPFIPGVSERMYSDEWLDEMNREENTPKIFKGKEYTAYEARQHQRYIERCMRAQREKVELLKEGGADKDEVMLARCKYQAQLDEYKRFSKAMKLPEQRERIYYDMKGRIAPPRDVYQKFLAEQAEKRRRIQTEADKHKERAEEARRAEIDLQDFLAQVYERRRTQQNLHMTPYEDIPRGDMNPIQVDLKKLNEKAREQFENVISKLSEKYDTSLMRIRTMTPQEALGNTAFATSWHTYSTGSAEMIVNPIKFGDYGKMISRMKELVTNGYIPRIKEGTEGEYVATHEFAHTLLNMQAPVSKSKNWVDLDLSRIRAARKEISKIYDEYKQEVKELEKEFKKAEYDVIMGTTNDTTAALKAKERLDAVRISRYSLESSDEFMADSFVQVQLAEKQSPYAKRVVAVLDKYYGKK